MRKFESVVAVVGCLAAMFLIVGCMNTNTWDQAGLWHGRADLQTQLPEPPQQVASAASATLENMRMQVLSEEATPLAGRMTARTDSRKHVTIQFRKGSGGGTDLSIRVGEFGDEVLSTTIFEQIKTQLAVARRQAQVMTVGGRAWDHDATSE